MNKSSKVVVALFIGASLVACSITPSGEPDNTPPRMVSYATNPNDNREVNVRAWNNELMREMGWDRPQAFGAVPENLQATGDSICQQALYQRAIGYHPLAQDMDGQPIPGGGYLCGGGNISG